MIITLIILLFSLVKLLFVQMSLKLAKLFKCKYKSNWKGQTREQKDGWAEA